MSIPAHEGAARVLVVGDDGEVGAMLHLHLLRAGWSPVCIPGPELVDALAPIVAPHAIVLVLPEFPATSWAAALTASASASQAGVRVVLVAPSRDVVEPLATVSGAERALSRSEVLLDPRVVLGPPPPRGIPSPFPLRRTGAGAITDSPTPAPRPFPASTAASLGLRLPPKLPDRPSDHRPPALGPGSLLEETLADGLAVPAVPTHLTADITLVSEHNFFVGPTRRLDSGGVFVSTPVPPPVGTSLEVRLGLPDARKIEVRGEVVFVRERGSMAGRQPTGCGVKIRELPSWALDVVERFFVARPPILYQP